MKFSNLRLIGFCALRATTKSGGGSTRIYNPASELNADKFVFDRNSHLKRQLLIEQKKFSQLPIICEKALPEDDDLLIDFYVTHFVHNEPINATLKLNTVEGREFMTALVKESTDNYIIRDNDKIIGVHSYKIGSLKEKPRKKQRLEDYGQLVDTGPFNHRSLNIIVTLLEASEVNMFSKMEPPCKYVYGMMGAIHPKYYGKKIAEISVIEAMKGFINDGIRYYCGDTTGDAFTRLYMKLPGFEVIDKLNYADFKIHGKAPFDELIEGTKCASIIFCDYKKWGNAYLKM